MIYCYDLLKNDVTLSSLNRRLHHLNKRDAMKNDRGNGEYGVVIVVAVDNHRWNSAIVKSACDILER